MGRRHRHVAREFTLRAGAALSGQPGKAGWRDGVPEDDKVGDEVNLEELADEARVPTAATDAFGGEHDAVPVRQDVSVREDNLEMRCDFAVPSEAAVRL